MQFITWLLTSSADPEAYSLTAKSLLLAAIPWIIQATGLACGLHVICLAVDGTVLTSAAETVANIVYLALSFIAAAGVLYGLGRKLWMGQWSAAQPIAPGV